MLTHIALKRRRICCPGVGVIGDRDAWGTMKTTSRLATRRRYRPASARELVADREAADLGGDCCFRFGDSVAELEANNRAQGQSQVRLVELSGQGRPALCVLRTTEEQRVYSV